MRLQTITPAGLALPPAPQHERFEDPPRNLVRQSKPDLGFELLQPLGRSAAGPAARSPD
ncbi:MAG: hypothetical protein HYS04_04050 [Acidobacteria bacterium]|nr:hypothetical protein [Acidobacteriota bacterium]